LDDGVSVVLRVLISRMEAMVMHMYYDLDAAKNTFVHMLYSRNKPDLHSITSLDNTMMRRRDLHRFPSCSETSDQLPRIMNC
jgi:hypothetical protein